MNWNLRTIAPELERDWIAKGFWTDHSLGQLIDAGLREHGDQPFTVRSTVHPHDATLAAVRDEALRLAQGLRDRGVEPGDVVAFQLPNWVEAAYVFYAAAFLGAVVMPIVHFYGPKEVGYILRKTPPRAYVTFDAFGALSGTRTVLESGAPLPELVAVVGDDPSGFEPLDAWFGAEPFGPLAIVDATAPALVAYTSGTTSDPKGVVHTHRTIGFEVRQLSSAQPTKAAPAIVGAPVGHGIGMLAALLIPAVQGKPIHLVDVWDPGAILQQMADEQLMSGTGATYFLTSLLDHPSFDPEVHLPLMRYIGLGGAAVPAAVADRATKLGISIVRMYGSTEHPSITGCVHEDPLDKRAGTDGHPLAGCEIRLADDGEIQSRGPDCFAGYTDEALTASVFDDDGWYHTGDIGVLDDDGYLRITDRKSDVIIRGGENISAAEVEEVLLRIPGVLECAVVAAPDDRLGEHACAFVRGVAPTLAELREAMAAAGLAKQKWPEEVRSIDEFPRTASGKVQKFVLRAQLREEVST
ncbi:MAG TPA: AMP-binding protein [Acidimicrobiales bacterium]|jgi:acyl-CoA synthetase (AMP-forming)/AMP-acid ligase II|nr:AMP-binding protein [Acidimicrobiales bacterium]